MNIFSNTRNILMALLVSGVFLGMPLSAQAVAQAPGEIPIVEPLRPPPAGVKPNYSKNIQNDHQEAESTTSEEGESEEATNNAVADVSETPTSRTWYYIIGFIAVLAAILIVLWKKKIIQISSNKNDMTKAILMALILPSIMSSFLLANRVSAQEVPKKDTIQRSIVEENADKIDLTPLDPQPVNPASSSVLYGLGAVVLIIVAVVVGSALWHNHKIIKPTKK